MTLGVRVAQTPVPDIQSLPVIGPGVMITVNILPDTPDLSSPVIPERLREVHLHPGAGLGHKVVNCQLPDRLEPHGGDGGAEAADGGPQVVRVDVAHAHVVRPILLRLALRSRVDVNEESLQFIVYFRITFISICATNYTLF